MTRFQKLAVATVAMTLLLVTIGVIVRVTDSGMGCPDWPLCHGQLIPPLDDPKAWIEWIHRTVAALIGFLVLGLALVAFLDHRDRPSLLWPSIGAVALVGFQAWLGRETVRLNNSGESVTAHLAAAMALVGLLVFILVRSFYPARIAAAARASGSRSSPRSAPVSVFALLLFGSHVTATSQWYVFPDWPLMNGSLFPPLSDVDVGARPPPLGRDRGRADRGRRRGRGPPHAARQPAGPRGWRSSPRSCSRSRRRRRRCRS